MTTWLSTTNMTRELGLKASPSDAEALRSEIRSEISTLHPDRNGGEFAKPEDQPRYQRLVEALEYIERPPSTALVPIQDIPALVAAVREALQPQLPSQTSAQARAEFREIARTDLHQRLFFPRVGSGAFAATCAFLLTLGDKLKANPLLGGWLQSRPGTMMITSMLIYSAVFFLMTWWMEQRAAAQSEWLATENGRQHIFSKLLGRLSSRPRCEGAARRFSFSEVVDAIVGPHRKALPFPFLSGRLSPAAAEKLAKAHLDELESRGVIKKTAGKRLKIVYEMDDEAAEELAGALGQGMEERSR